MSRDSDDKPKPKRSPLRRLALCTLLLVVVGACAVFGIRYQQASANLQAEIQQLRDRGVPLRVEDFAVADSGPDDDAAPLVRKAIAALHPPDDAYLTLLMAEPPTPAGDYAAFRDELAANQATLDLITAAVKRPHCRLVLNAAGEPSNDVEVFRCRELAELLHAQCLQSLGTKQTDAAVAAAMANLQLADLVIREPTDVSQQVGQIIFRKSLASLAELLAHAKISRETYKDLDRRLRFAEEQCRWAPAITLRRAEFVEQIEAGRDFVIYDETIPTSAGNRLGRFWKRSFLGRPAALDRDAFWLRSISELAEIVDRERLDDAANADWESRIHASGQEPVHDYLANSAFLRKLSLETRQRLILARWGLRVDQYFRRHGKFPDSLAEVCDEELPLVRPDILFGKPLIYRTYEHGFIIRLAHETAAEPENLKFCRFEVTYPAGDLQDAADVSTQDSGK